MKSLVLPIFIYLVTSVSLIADEAYFRSLLHRGPTDIELQNLLQLWNSMDVDPHWNTQNDKKLKSLSWIQRCGEVGIFPFRESKVAGEYLESDCQPDVLYSWGPKIKIENFLIDAPNNQPWSDSFKGDRTLYLALTPAITFMYGDYLQRFKVKRDTRFKSYGEFYRNNWRDCGDVPEEVKNTTIFVHIRPITLYEFIVCSPKVFESWSYNTTQNYDELVKDFIWIGEHFKLGKFKRYTLYYPDLQNGSVHPLLNGGIDGHDASEAKFKRILIDMVRSILSSEGGIFFPEGIDAKENHFSARRPTWFNER